MAEQLGDAVLKVRADTTDLDAGLARSQQAAQRTGQATEQAFNRTGRALQTAANGTQYFTDAQGRARDASGRFLSQAEKQAAGIARLGDNASSSIRSIQSLREKLSSLRATYETVQVGSKGFRDLQREIQKTERELQKLDNTLGNTLRQRASGFGQNLATALGLGLGAGAGFAVGGFLKDSVNQAVQLETITRKLQNSLGEQGAGAALNFTRTLAGDLGLNFRTLADAYSRFTAAATAANVPLQTQRELFASVSKAGQALGLSNDEINGSFLALQQVASKGTVAMEELRGQLGERLPIALAATAKGLGLSQQELIKLVETGRLSAGEFFPALTRGLNELTASSGGALTAAQNFQKLGNAWEELQRSVGQNLLPGITSAVVGLSDSLEGRTAALRAGNLVKDFGISIDYAEQLVGLQNVIQNKYNLTEQQANKLTADTIKTLGIEQNLFKQRILTSEQFLAIQLKLPELAKQYREQNKDNITAAKELAAQEESRIQALKKATAVKQKELDFDLRRNLAAAEYTGLQEKFQAVQRTPGLNAVQQVQLQNELTLNEQIRKVVADRLLLRREEDKPRGTGDGKNDTQSEKQIQQIQDRIRAGQLGIATAREQAAQAEADALRTQEDRIRGLKAERAAADQRLTLTVRQTDLERQSLAFGIEASRTAALRLQLQDQLTTATRAQADVIDALTAERARPEGLQNIERTNELAAKISSANANVRQAYADAGKSLVDNARSAAQALRGAHEGLQSTLRGGFDLLTRPLQREQIERAQAAIQPLVDRGVIRTGIDISTPERLFSVAGFAESFSKAQAGLEQALSENAAATGALTDKDWNVVIKLPGQQTVLPLANT